MLDLRRHIMDSRVTVRLTAFYLFLCFAARIPAKCKCKWVSPRLQRCFYTLDRLFINLFWNLLLIRVLKEVNIKIEIERICTKTSR